MEREEFDLIGTDGKIIDPYVWPAALADGCIVELLLWVDAPVQSPRSQLLHASEHDDDSHYEGNVGHTSETEGGRCKASCRRRQEHQRLQEENERLRESTQRLEGDNLRLAEESREHREDARRIGDISRGQGEQLQRQQDEIQHLRDTLSRRDSTAQQRDRDVRARERDAHAREHDVGAREAAVENREAAVLAREQPVVQSDEVASSMHDVHRNKGSPCTGNAWPRSRRGCLYVLACRVPLCSCSRNRRC